MIINNAASRSDVDFWTKHLQNTEDNERAELKQIRGLRADTLREALEEMQSQARINPRVENFMYHADFNPCPHEHLTAEQRDRAFEIFERQRGIPADAARVVMEHVKNGRQHWHVIWYRLNEQGRPFSDKLDAKIAHSAAREIERELGLQKVVGPFDREAGTPRPKRAPKPWEMYRGMKTNIDPRDVTAEVTDLRQQCADGIEFHAALETRGYILARGDKIIAGAPALMVIDPAGSAHQLTRRIDGMNSKQVNEFMRDVDRAALPDIRQAQAIHQDRKIAALEADRDTVKQEIEWEEKLAKAAIEKEKIEGRFIAPEDREKETRGGGQEKEPQSQPQQPPHPRSAAGKIHDVHVQSDKTQEFQAALEQKGIAFAVASPDEAYRSHREAQFAKAIDRRSAMFEAGEIVAVSGPGLLYHRKGEWTEPPRVHKLDQAHAEKYLDVLSLDKSKLKGIDATKEVLNASAQDRAAYWQSIRLERATNINNWAPIRAARDAKAPRIIDAASSVAFGTVAKGFDVVASIFESVFSPKLTPEQIRQGELSRQDRQAEAERSIDFSNYTAAAAQEKQNHQEQQAARDRQREIERER